VSLYRGEDRITISNNRHARGSIWKLIVEVYQSYLVDRGLQIEAGLHRPERRGSAPLGEVDDLRALRR